MDTEAVFFLKGEVLKVRVAYSSTDQGPVVSLRLKGDPPYEAVWRTGGIEAERLLPYLRYGAVVNLEGRLLYRTWEDRLTGKIRKRLEMEVVRAALVREAVA